MLKSIKDITDENLKEAKAADITKLVDSEISRINEEYKTQKEKTDKELESSANKAKELEDKLKETDQKLAKATEDLNKLVEANKQREIEEVFSNRMNYFDSEFELDEKTRNSVAKRIKGLDEEAYKTEKEDLEVLLAAKKKEKMIEHKEEGECSCAKCAGKKKEAKASVEKEGEAALDNAIDKGEKKKAAAAATTAVTETTQDKYAKNFGIENWEISTRKNRK